MEMIFYESINIKGENVVIMFIDCVELCLLKRECREINRK
jgi:hypothetical protein